MAQKAARFNGAIKNHADDSVYRDDYISPGGGRLFVFAVRESELENGQGKKKETGKRVQDTHYINSLIQGQSMGILIFFSNIKCLTKRWLVLLIFYNLLLNKCEWNLFLWTR